MRREACAIARRGRWSALPRGATARFDESSLATVGCVSSVRAGACFHFFSALTAGHALRFTAGLLGALLSVCVVSHSARADDASALESSPRAAGPHLSARAPDGAPQSDDQADSLVIPPPPMQIPPRLALEVHTGLTLPLDNDALCPSAAGCVLQSGGGIGVSVERRWPTGFGGLLAYDVWFLDSDSVYELAVQQLFRAGARYTMPTDFVFHPIFELSLGVMGLGDIFRIATAGVLIQTFSGVETELTESVGVRIGMGLRAFSHSPFRTQRDGVRRGGGAVHFSEAFFIEVGLTVM